MKRLIKRFLSVALIIIFMLNFTFTAFADENDVTYASATNGESTTVEGNVIAIDENHDTAVSVNVVDGGSAEIVVHGDIDIEHEGYTFGVAAFSWNGDSMSVTVDGDISVLAKTTTKEENIDLSDTDVAYGIDAFALAETGNSQYSITVGGDVTAVSEDNYSMAVEISALPDNENSVNASVNIGGNVTAIGGEYASGIKDTMSSNSTLDITVGGDVTAIAENGNTSGVHVGRNGDNASIDVSVGGSVISESSGAASGVSIFADDGAQANVTIGDGITSTGSQEVGALFTITSNATTNVEIGSDVSVESSNGAATAVDQSVSTVHYDYIYNEETEDFERIELTDITPGDSILQIGGSVSAVGESATAVRIINDDASLNTCVSGQVEATAVEDATGLNLYSAGGNTLFSANEGIVVSSEQGVATAANVSSYCVVDYTLDEETGTYFHEIVEPGTAESCLTIGGPIVAEGNKAVGLALHAGEGGSTTATLNGNLTVSGEENATAIYLNNSENGIVDVSVSGDVSSNDVGIQFFTYGEESTGTANITIDGTLSGDNAPILLSTIVTEDELTLTVWKIDLTDDGRAVIADNNDEAGEDYNQALEEAAESIEENIFYIIRVEQPTEGGTINLSGTSQSDGFEVAKEGDTVTLALNVAEGYKVDAAYNGEGNRIALLQDENGNYYIVIPTGGGVYLSAELSPVQKVVTTYSAYTPHKNTVVSFDSTSSVDDYGSIVLKTQSGEIINRKVKISFYDDGSFVVTANNTETLLNGQWKIMDGILHLISSDGTDKTVDESGFVSFVLSNGSILEITLAEKTIEIIKNY